MDLGLVPVKVTNRLLATEAGPRTLPTGVGFTPARAMKDSWHSADLLKVTVRVSAAMALVVNAPQYSKVKSDVPCCPPASFAHASPEASPPTDRILSGWVPASSSPMMEIRMKEGAGVLKFRLMEMPLSCRLEP